jgi:imidazoleglycerol phosphate synthase glutamine amidotransferase subunit HisH
MMDCGAPESVDLNYFDAWVQIHKLSDGYRTKSLVTNLVEKKIGEVYVVEIVLPGVRNFVRARVKIDVQKALVSCMCNVTYHGRLLGILMRFYLLMRRREEIKGL